MPDREPVYTYSLSMQKMGGFKIDSSPYFTTVGTLAVRRAFSVIDGKEAKGKHYGFIKTVFRELKSGVKSWSEITREDWQFVESEKQCIYCGSKIDLHKEHIVPKSLRAE